MTEPISNQRRVPAAFTAAMKRFPASRPEAVRRARRLIKDTNYPSPAMLRSLSEFFVDRILP